VQVDGASLPYHGTTTLTLRGSLTIQTNNHYVLTQTDSAIAGGAAIVSTYQGLWSLSENAYVLTDANNSIVALAAVSADGDTLRASVSPTLHTNLYVKN
jgi:hypothetical protein